VIERLDELEASIQRWLEKNRQYIQFVVPIENALTTDPVQAMFCGPVAQMQRALQMLGSCGLPITVLRTEYRAAISRLSMCLMRNVPRGMRWSAGLITGGLRASRSWPLVTITTILNAGFRRASVYHGNASEELRGRGWALTRSNAASGVAAAIEHLLYGKALEAGVVDEIGGAETDGSAIVSSL